MFKWGLRIVFPVHWYFEVNTHFFGFTGAFYYYFVLYILEIVLLAVYFTRLYTLMENYHNFEFNRSKTAIKNFFIYSLFSILLTLLTSVMRFKALLPTTLSERYEFCQTGSAIKVINFLQSWLSKVSFLPQILICIAVIYQKSSDDFLQKVNKLDSLAKVSIFQSYKKVDALYLKMKSRINE